MCGVIILANKNPQTNLGVWQAAVLNQAGSVEFEQFFPTAEHAVSEGAPDQKICVVFDV